MGSSFLFSRRLVGGGTPGVEGDRHLSSHDYPGCCHVRMGASLPMGFPYRGRQRNPQYSPARYGSPLDPEQPKPLHYLILFFVSLVLFFLLIQLAFGKTLVGIRDSESRMKVMGYNVWLHKYFISSSPEGLRAWEEIFMPTTTALLALIFLTWDGASCLFLWCLGRPRHVSGRRDRGFDHHLPGAPGECLHGPLGHDPCWCLCHDFCLRTPGDPWPVEKDPAVRSWRDAVA